MKFRSCLPTLVLAMAASSLAISGSPAQATTPRVSASPPAAPGADDPTSALDERESLPPGWRRSPDQLWTLRGDATGLHLLVADSADGYAWRTITSLSEPGLETDRWIGNGCLTASGRYAVVVYAPRAFTNRPATFLRGGFAAVVDLRNGNTRKLPVTGSLSYYDPGCGAGEDAVITQSLFAEEGGRRTATRMVRVHAPTATLGRAIEKGGQYDAAVPVRTGIVAARGDSLVQIDRSGATRTLVASTHGAFDLAVDRAGGVVYLSGTERRNRVVRVPVAGSGRRSPQTLLQQKGSWLGLARGAHGSVFALDPDGRRGTASAVARAPGAAPSGIRVLRAGPADEVSTTGAAVLSLPDRHVPAGPAGTSAPDQTLDLEEGGGLTVDLTARFPATGATVDFRLPSALRPSRRASTGAESSPARPTDSLAPAGVIGTDEPTATCAVARNDARTQVYQPTPRQVEWAVDQAVVGNLLTARPANWKQSGLPSYTPQVMFPNPTLHGGGRVPAQVLLGILAQESNLWQASGHALSGEFGNPLVGDFYGRDGGWTIDYSQADCGYGIGQVTDGMRKGQMDATKQRAIAMDYEANISRSLQILVEKWNQLYDVGMLHDNGNPSSIENWVFAVWAYNTGFYPNTGVGSPWGVGWLNNPANPIYPVNRLFFNANPADPSHPGDWPYQEKVVGWAAYSIATADGVGFRPAWWVTNTDRDRAKPPVYTFCDSSNSCTPNTANPCPAVSSVCWWHKPVTFNNCTQGYCGHELLRFNTTYPEQPDGTHYPPACSLAGLPSGSLVVDDVPDSVTAPRAGCGHPWTSAGAFSLDFANASGRIDFHQVGGGFGGHFWFAHTRTYLGENGLLEVTGTWSFSQNLSGQWGRVLVHVPDHGAETQQAGYKIDRGDGTSETRYTPQRMQANEWVDLGVLQFKGMPSISLSSQTWDGTGSDDVAFDAVAIQPLPSKPRNIVVALGDSYSSGEGANDPDGGDDYYEETDFGGEYGAASPRRNACHRSPHAWSRKATLQDSASSIGARSDSFDPTMDFHMIACSGAESENLLPFHSAGVPAPTNAQGQSGTGQYGELSQLDQGYLDENTTLVMFSIGGNDAQFGPIMAVCLSPLDVGDDCRAADTVEDGVPNDVAVPDLIRDTVGPSVLTVVRQVHQKAPNAKIVLMGYPQLISNWGDCPGALGLNPDEADWINNMSLVMDNTLATDVATLNQEGIAVEIGAPIGDFMGRGVCGDPESINGVVMNRTDGDPPVSQEFPASAQSFHPKIDGTTLYANAAVRALRSLGL